ncbi:putative Lecithin:cholesterol/phospholipid:diacylglycerol acyltransferase [Cocos nucifera]|uniref:Putative Lecithin:cholesterol/phospholipid:diacylglycerol acyltransferase n=1 Tax=Cocos nucifera TaxID=13894 RepID=A0A8K0IB58_COCNU|nr:putative Lecithin:cholesterol/phospholipid:diacylglycerol acyltransferase [Cocos nucifera]
MVKTTAEHGDRYPGWNGRLYGKLPVNVKRQPTHLSNVTTSPRKFGSELVNSPRKLATALDAIHFPTAERIAVYQLYWFVFLIELGLSIHLPNPSQPEVESDISRSTEMDDYFIRLLKLSSYITHRFIKFIEYLVIRDVERVSQDSEASFSRWNGRIAVYQLYWFVFLIELGLSIHLPNPSQPEVESDISRSTEMDDYFIRLLKLSSYITHRFIKFIEYLVIRDVERVSQDSEASFSRWNGRIICRMTITLQGSSEDIGWLQRTEGLPPVEDGTTQFMELLHDISLLDLSLQASVEKNAWELKQYIEELYWGSGKQVLLLGHSKGGVDAAAALSLYWSDLKEKVAGLALVQSPYGGSPLASDILREGQIADKEARRIMEFIICKLIKGDIRALEDLTYEKRKDFITKHRLPSEQIPLISFHTEASVAPGVLATMSLIAHAELPWLPFPHFFSECDENCSGEAGRKVPVLIPLAAAMAVSALHLRLRYGEKSDGLVARCDAEVPGSVVVRPDRKLDHTWMVQASLKKDQFEADASEMCEALLTMLVEIGRKKQVIADAAWPTRDGCINGWHHEMESMQKALHL